MILDIKQRSPDKNGYKYLAKLNYIDNLVFNNIYINIKYKDKLNINSSIIIKNNNFFKFIEKNKLSNFIDKYSILDANYSNRNFYKDININIKNSLDNTDDIVSIASPSIYTGFIRSIRSESLKEFVFNKLNLSVESLKSKGIILALLLGDRTRLTTDQYSNFISTGTAHLIAISGMHISLVFYLIFNFSGYFWHISLYKYFCIPRKSFSILLASLVAGLYAYLSGFSVPTERAYLSVFITSILYFNHLKISIYNLFGYCLLLVLILDSNIVANSGFWLSFVASFWLIYLFSNRFDLNKDKNKNKTNITNKIRSEFKNNIITCFKSFIALMPITLWFFNKISVIHILANTIAIPYISFIILPILILVLILIIINYILNIIFLDFDFLLDIINFLIMFMLDVSSKFLDVLSKILDYLEHNIIDSYIILFKNYFYLNNIEFIILNILVLLLLAPKGIPKALININFIILFYFNYGNYNNKDINNKDSLLINIFDVGQGLSVLINTSNHILLYDTGIANNYISDKIITNTILDYKSSSKQKLEKIIISHWDSDHSGNLLNILNNFHNKIDLYSSDINKFNYKYNINNYLCSKQYNWQWDNINFEFFDIDPNNLKSNSHVKNNLSCVLKISTNNFSILLTGDIEAVAESELSREYKDRLKSDILLIPHHGSKTSSSDNFIKQVAPDVGIISVGKNNIYRLPNPDIITKYNKLGIKLFRTDLDGALKILALNNKIYLHTTDNLVYNKNIN